MRIGSKTLTGAHIKKAQSILKVKDLIMNGYLIATDPASKSMGYAVYKKGVLEQSGTFKAQGDIGIRLGKIMHQLRTLPQADVVAMERVGGGMKSSRFLIWSCGAIAGALSGIKTLEIDVPLWGKWKDKDYIKDDETDAIYIGRCVVDICKYGEL